MAGVYLSRVVSERVQAAQDLFDAHPVSSVDDRCLLCDGAAPCRYRQAALHVITRYGCLPRRRRGATRPELVHPVNAQASRSGFDWFAH